MSTQKPVLDIPAEDTFCFCTVVKGNNQALGLLQNTEKRREELPGQTKEKSLFS